MDEDRVPLQQVVDMLAEASVKNSDGLVMLNDRLRVVEERLAEIILYLNEQSRQPKPLAPLLPSVSLR